MGRIHELYEISIVDPQFSRKSPTVNNLVRKISIFPSFGWCVMCRFDGRPCIHTREMHRQISLYPNSGTRFSGGRVSYRAGNSRTDPTSRCNDGSAGASPSPTTSQPASARAIAKHALSDDRQRAVDAVDGTNSIGRERELRSLG